MDNSLKTKAKPPEAEGYRPPAKGKTKTLLIGKELEKKDLHHTAAERASGPPTKSPPKTRIKASSMAERFPFGPSTRSAPPLFLAFKDSWIGPHR